MFDQASLEYYAIRLDKFIVCRYFEFVIFWILSKKIPETDNHFLVTFRNMKQNDIFKILLKQT